MNNIDFNRSAIEPSECIGGGWNVVTSKFWLYVGIGLLTMVLIGCVPIVGIIMMGPVLGGFYYVVLRDLDGEPVDFGMMFKGFEKFVPLMVIGVIQSIPGLVFQVIQWTMDITEYLGGPVRGGSTGDFFQPAPDVAFGGGLSAVFIMFTIGFVVLAVLWSLGFFFAIPLAMERDLGAVDAIKLSFSATFGNLGGLILLIILEALVVILGAIALCIGLLVAIPVIYAANVFAYRQVFPSVGGQRWTSPPPPSAYGDTFGQGV